MKTDDQTTQDSTEAQTPDGAGLSASACLDDLLRLVAGLWWITWTMEMPSKSSFGWVCRASGKTADSADCLWEKVKPDASQLYLGKTWQQFRYAMEPQSKDWPDEPWPEYAWAFLPNAIAQATTPAPNNDDNGNKQ